MLRDGRSGQEKGGLNYQTLLVFIIKGCFVRNKGIWRVVLDRQSKPSQDLSRIPSQRRQSLAREGEREGEGNNPFLPQEDLLPC